MGQTRCLYLSDNNNWQLNVSTIQCQRYSDSYQRWSCNLLPMYNISKLCLYLSLHISWFIYRNFEGSFVYCKKAYIDEIDTNVHNSISLWTQKPDGSHYTKESFGRIFKCFYIFYLTPISLCNKPSTIKYSFELKTKT